MSDKAKIVLKGKRSYGFCAFCAAHGEMREGVFVYWHTANEDRLLCRACWERLHDEWVASAGSDDELPFDSYADGRIAGVRALYGRRGRLESALSLGL